MPSPFLVHLMIPAGQRACVIEFPHTVSVDEVITALGQLQIRVQPAALSAGLEEGLKKLEASLRRRDPGRQLPNLTEAVGRIWARPIEVSLKPRAGKQSDENPFHPLHRVHFGGLWPEVDAGGRVVVGRSVALGDEDPAVNMRQFVTRLLELAAAGEVLELTPGAAMDYVTQLGETSKAKVGLLTERARQRQSDN